MSNREFSKKHCLQWNCLAFHLLCFAICSQIILFSNEEKLIIQLMYIYTISMLMIYRSIIIIYSGYPLYRSVFQWGPAKIMYNTVTIQYNTINDENWFWEFNDFNNNLTTCTSLIYWRKHLLRVSRMTIYLEWRIIKWKFPFKTN